MLVISRLGGLRRAIEARFTHGLRPSVPMMGGRSLKLATLFGIRIGVSTSWFVVLFLLLYVFTQNFQDSLGIGSTEAFAVAAAAVVLFFGSILLHELGHALAAIREGIEVAGIDLFIFGGVMKMNREGTTAGAMFRIAAAGPAGPGGRSPTT